MLSILRCLRSFENLAQCIHVSPKTQKLTPHLYNYFKPQNRFIPTRFYSNQNQKITKNAPESLKYFDYSHISLPGSPIDFSLDDFIILPKHFTHSEQEFLLNQSSKKLKREFGKQVVYQEDHFDGVIFGYRECHASHWGEDEDKVMEIFHKKVYNLFPEITNWLPAHILDLSESGGIQAHIDHVEYSGNIVAGVCLSSSAVMFLRHQDNSQFYFSVLLEPGCLYIQRDTIRYKFTHEIPVDQAEHMFKGELIPKARRISLLFRNEYEDVHDEWVLGKI
ncbi:10923_t:CDS:2 [Acaulospora morrowiae]|uniref:10923_t:CDS:1 n=1 Tax=Acaulospora morrowiae TaxID=94023 RepID=A0A9N9DFC5_9GLOM|nr:10923_t:CDS:2 [Acaulospora morrowiae]